MPLRAPVSVTAPASTRGWAPGSVHGSPPGVGRPTTRQRLAAVLLAAAVAVAAPACVGRKGNNDGPKREGEPNPAQPYEGERHQLEQDSQRSG